METENTETALVIEVETTEAERLAAVSAANRRLMAAATQRAWLRPFFLWLAVGLVVGLSANLSGREWLASEEGYLWLAALALGAGFLQAWRQRCRLMGRLAREQVAAYRITPEAGGLRVDSERGSTHLNWTALEAVEDVSGVLILHLKGFQALCIPHRNLPEGPERAAFIARMRESGGLDARPVATYGCTPAPRPAGGRLLADLGRNVLAGFLFLALRPSAARRLQVSVSQLILLLLADIFLSGGLDFWRIGGDGDFNPAGLLPLFFGIPWLLLAAWATARAGMNESRTLAGAVALASLWLVVGIVWGALSLLPAAVWRALDDAAPLLWWAPFAYGLLASIPALVRTVGLLPEQRLGAVLAVVYLMGLPPFIFDQKESLWVARHDEAAEAAARARWQSTTSEAVLYAQPRLLQEALERVKPGRPGVPELFLLAVGGYGGQDVFLREVQAVQGLFQERFDTAGRSVVLVNNPATVAEQPIASVTALSRSLVWIGQRMNPDEDVLVLFMTSHGSPDHRFDLNLWPYRFDDLTPERLHALMQAAGIRYRVVVVSACYSGGFVPALADNDSLVISASRHDLNSHGCSHEADWTFFGRAFFQEALRGTHSFEMAFDQARVAVAEREAAENFAASEPQIAVGNGIRVALRAVERRLEGGRGASR